MEQYPNLREEIMEALKDPKIQREFEEMGKRISSGRTWKTGDLVWDPEDDDTPMDNVDNVDNVDNTIGCIPMDSVGSLFSNIDFINDLTPNNPDKIEIGQEEKG